MIKLDLHRFKTREELESYTESLFIQVGVLQNQIKELEDRLVGKQTSEPPKVSLEEDLLIRELEYMDKLSRTGGLSLDETKQLKMIMDALVALRRVEKGLGEDTKKKPKKQDTAKLLKMIKGGKLE